MVTYLRSNAAPGLTLLLALALYSCGGGDGGTTDPITTGTVSVTVSADGDPIAGVAVALARPGTGTSTFSAATSASGTASFNSIDEGNWNVEIDVPSGFELAPGEDDTKTITVVAGQTVSASFSLVDQFAGVTVEALGNLTFSQADVTISAGTAVRWVNATSTFHTVTPDGHSEWSSADLDTEGSTFIHTFNTPGTYPYFCTPHQGAGMTGTITVQ